MIQMPRRSVTRFFIPLIDVLILLFCIFLLMEFNSESEASKQSDLVAEQSEVTDRLRFESQESAKKLEDLQRLDPDRKEMDRLRQEIADLKKAVQQDPNATWDFRTVDIKAEDGSISFFDRQENKVISIENEAAAKKLIKEHLQEARERRKMKVYYFFEYPRDRQTFLDIGQRQLYHKWFKGPNVSNSLPE